MIFCPEARVSCLNAFSKFPGLLNFSPFNTALWSEPMIKASGWRGEIACALAMARRTTISSTGSFSSGVSSISGESHSKLICNRSRSAFLKGEVEPRTSFIGFCIVIQEVADCLGNISVYFI